MTTGNVLGDVAHASEFGAAIRDMREEHGRSLSEVSSTLRVRQSYLEAIEEGRFEDLPGATYASGFVRAYADYLGLDVPEVMRRYRDIQSGKPAYAAATPPTPVVEGRMPTGFILFVAGLLALGAYGTWYYLTLHGRDATQVVSEIPGKIANMVSGDQSDSADQNAGKEPAAVIEEKSLAPADTDATNSASEPKPAGDLSPVVEETVVKPAKEMMAATTGAASDGAAVAAAGQSAASETPSPETASSTETVASTVNEAASSSPEASTAEPTTTAMTDNLETTSESAQPATPSETASTAPESEITPETIPTPAAPVVAAVTAEPNQPAEDSRVVLRATEASWVELRQENGDRVISRILKPGETYRVPAQSGIKMMTGNAGGIDILVDGKLLPPLGPAGAVRRDILLEPDALATRRPAE